MNDNRNDAQNEIDPATSPAYDPSRHMRLLAEGSQQLGIALDDEHLARFEQYYRELVEWNAKFNLTAITGYEDVQVKHFLDCIAALPILGEEPGVGFPPAKPLHLIDVGSGAGFPGVPLKLAAPRLKLTLLDGTGKKVEFLNHLVRVLELQNTEVVQGRAEEVGRNQAFRGQFDLVAARAVAPMATLVEYLLPLVRRDGYAVIYKGPSAAQEFVAARRAIDILGGEPVRFAPVQVPFLDEQRFILLIKKTRQTPQQYPRGQGLARKKPLG